MIHVYFVLVFDCCYVYTILIVVLILTVVYLLLRKTGTSVIVQVRSDAG